MSLVTKRGLGVATLLLAGSFALAACTIGDPAPGGSDGASASSSTEAAKAKPVIEVSAKNKATGVSVLDPVQVTAKTGKLADVTVTNDEGVKVAGAIGADGVWASSEPLGYGRTYTVNASAKGEGGTTTNKSTFTTVQPNNLTLAYHTVDGATVGIGQPVAIQFDEPISNRRAAQDAITVTTEPAVEGAFYWVNNNEVRWRPAEYWAPGTQVKVSVNTYGKDLGGGIYGQENNESSFTIGDEVIATIDDNDKQIVVTRNGAVERVIPTSLGKAGHETPNGVYYVAEKHDHIVMDSSTYGVPVNSAEGYRTDVNFATRLSYSGIFVHSAPWSLWAQGNTNTSHGCPNVSPTDAQWFMNNTKRGDVVVVSNTGGPTLSGVDGLGDWNIDWETWKAGNADDGPSA